jgi:hypothetical protein
MFSVDFGGLHEPWVEWLSETYLILYRQALETLGADFPLRSPLGLPPTGQ